MKNTRKLIQTIILLLIITGCAKQKELSTRDVAISLIEKNFYADGRKLEYSQIDSTNAELQGYTIYRVYISNEDSIKFEGFHINYIKTKVDKIGALLIRPEAYKTLLVNNNVFTDNLEEDFGRILGGLSGAKITDEMRRAADSIRIADSIVNSVPF